jgi:outer membrane receptor protein involved in Fe transport
VFDDIEPVSWHAVNPKWILAYTPSERSRYYLTAAKGFRAPVLDDLCRSARTMRGLRVANPELRPEHVFHFETGADQKIHQLFEIKWSAYYTSGNDFMQLLSTGDSVNLGYTIAPVYHTANISRVILFGGEAEVIGQVHPSLIVSMNYTYTHPTIDRFVPESDADIDLSGKYLANIPFHRFAMSARGNTKWVNASLTARYTGSRYIRDDNQVDMIYLLKDRFDPSLTLDFKIYRTFNRFRVSIEIDNLTNQQYINNRGYKSPGRMIFLSVGYNTQSLLK